MYQYGTFSLPQLPALPFYITHQMPSYRCCPPETKIGLLKMIHSTTLLQGGVVREPIEATTSPSLFPPIASSCNSPFLFFLFTLLLTSLVSRCLADAKFRDVFSAPLNQRDRTSQRSRKSKVQGRGS
ncbi:hypothetical protein EYF80_001404 [Liparis tanakae]|uniref:Uncharacterized protein n=1 Tax=Liparis tanakae TaxID=230148 RepID=A0A4Z2JEY5_9TELE|nr:hypothetical protein EYF80_001404 [Liparis tanakae]